MCPGHHFRGLLKSTWYKKKYTKHVAHICQRSERSSNFHGICIHYAELRCRFMKTNKGPFFFFFFFFFLFCFSLLKITNDLNLFSVYQFGKFSGKRPLILLFAPGAKNPRYTTVCNPSSHRIHWRVQHFSGSAFSGTDCILQCKGVHH